MWIELTKTQNKDTMLVNLDNILQIKINWYDQREGSTLYAVDGTTIMVAETKAQIKALIEKAHA